jgi:GNAT superfamily N-acetyltransferase
MDRINILNCTSADIDKILQLYEQASSLQRSKGVVPWPRFDRDLVETAVNESRQWKLEIGGRIACVWTITFEDPQIWEERDHDPSIYIHRITTAGEFRGRKLIDRVIDWAKHYAVQQGKRFVRLDTVGQNKALIKLYQSSGFDFLGLFRLKNTGSLPAHYQDADVSLFEMEILAPGDVREWNRDELAMQFARYHEQFLDCVCSLTDEEWMYSHEGKWSAGQQLEHLGLCLKPINYFLSSKPIMIEKFGMIDRKPMTHFELIAHYKLGLRNGGKASERFLPSALNPGQRQELTQTLKEQVSEVQRNLSLLTEQELDSLVLPHPFLGKLTVRELLYLMTHHATHHEKQVKCHLSLIPAKK